MMSADILKKYSDRMDTERRTEHLNRIELEVRRLTDLLEDILVMNRGQTMGIQFNPTQVDLEMLCHDIVAGMQSLHPKNPIDYSRSCSSTFMWLDAKLMRQAITNLMSNAIKYSHTGSQVHLHLSCDDKEIIIQVRDHGRGIPRKDQPNLFQTFYRASNVGSIAGTGLGLAIVKLAAEAHAGVVTFESEEHVGTTFTMTLPLRSG
jgi:signal transduction histidine kinase